MTEKSPLQTIRDKYIACLNLNKDDQLLPDFIISLLVSNLTPALDEPVWGHIIGPPSTSKTESLRPLMTSEDCVFVSSLTENALLSGYTTEDGEDPSLILHLNHKVLVWKDLTTLLNDNPQKVSKIYGDLRDAFDGTCAKPSGRSGLRSYTAKFGVIAAVTNSIDAFSEDNQQLGERFLSFRTFRYTTSAEDNIAFLRKVRASTHNKALWRSELAECVLTQLHKIKGKIPTLKEMPTVSEGQERILLILSYLLSQFRTTPIKGHPVDAEMGARVSQQLYNLGCARVISDNRTAWDDSDMDFIRRIVIDTMTTPRRRLLLTLYGDRNLSTLPLDLPTLATRSRMPQQYLANTLIQWSYCKLVKTSTASVDHPSKAASAPILFELTSKTRSLLQEASLFEPGPAIPQLTVKATVSEGEIRSKIT